MSAQYPEYAPEAQFRCNRGCGTFRRDKCNTFRGQLCCPRCGWAWTLSFVPISRPAMPKEEDTHG